MQELSTGQAIVCQKFLPVEPPAGNTLLLFLLRPTYVQRVQANKGDIEDEKV